jgi:glycosyltransferase involved in cell wall biosynthesis
VVSYVGHFNHVKGVDVLVRAFPKVLRQRPDARLVLAWSGLGPLPPIQRAIQQSGVADRVHLLGRLPLGGVLRRSAVLALPYRLSTGQATYPSLLLEAMTVGVPLVTSDLPLFREFLTDGETAELARPGDADGVAHRILQLLNSPSACDQMIENQHNFTRQAFDPNHLAHRYEDLYEDVAHARGRAEPKAHVLSPATSRSRL